MSDFVCQKCKKTFSVPDAALTKYPNWTPRICRSCRSEGEPASGKGGRVHARSAHSLEAKSPQAGGSGPATHTKGSARSRTLEQDLPVAEVLRLYQGGPLTGVFTDGAANPNPGPGGWGAVYVEENQIVAERCGHEPMTTNNRMELMALLAGIDLVPPEKPMVIYSDSMLCINTFTRWVAGWEARGWKRKEGPIKNLDLVQEIHQLLKTRDELKLEWIPAHNGYRWNEYADALATAYRRSVR